MKKLLSFILTLILFASSVSNTLGCCDDPIASWSISPATYDPVLKIYYVCKGRYLTCDGSASQDPDCSTCTGADYCGDGVGLRKGIRKFKWNFTATDQYTETYGSAPDGAFDGKHSSYKFTNTGVELPEFKVWDNDNPCCCNSNLFCFDREAQDAKAVVVVDVDEIVKTGTDDSGTLYVCAEDTVNLTAKPDPGGSLWPPDGPDWGIIIQPAGADASLNPQFNTATTTVSGLTKAGLYRIRAQCCSSCTVSGGTMGDTIDIKVVGGAIVILDACGDTNGKYLLLANPASSSPLESYGREPGQPTGTTYKWEISSGDDKAHIVGSDTDTTVDLKADAEGDLTLKLTCTYDSLVCVSTLDTSVHKPNKANSSVTCTPVTWRCFITPPYMDAWRYVYYYIRDGSNNDVPHALWDESWSGGCNLDEGDAYTNCGGVVTDMIWCWRSSICNSHGILCSDTQTIKISGWPVSGVFWTNTMRFVDGVPPSSHPYIDLPGLCP